MERRNSLARWLLLATTVGVMTFLLAPIFVVVASSFTEGRFISFPPQGASTQWYADAAQNKEFRRALSTSAMLATACMVLSTLVGSLAALGLVRYRFRGGRVIETLLLSPLMVPAVVLGIAIMQFLAQVGMLGSLWGVLLGHLVVTLPFAVRLVAVSLARFDWNLERAALGLGASRTAAYLTIILPVIRPGLIGAAAFSFILSFDEVTVSLFTSSIGVATLPVVIFRWVQYSFEPVVAAASSITVIIAAIAMFVVDRAVGLQHAAGQAPTPKTAT